MKRSFLKTALISAITLLSATGCDMGGSAKVSITMWTTFAKDTQDVLNRQVKNFVKLIKDNEGIDVEIKTDPKGGYDEVEGFVVDSFTTGNIPNLVVAYPDNVANYLSRESTPGEYVVNLQNYVNSSEFGFDQQDYLNPSKKGINDFVESFVDEGTHYIRNGMYSLPYMKSTEIMLYNKSVVSKLLTDMGIQTGVERYMREITWDQLIALLRYANDHRLDYGLKDADACPLYYDSDGNYFISQCYQRNAPYISLNGTKGSIDFVNDQAKAIVSEIKSLYDEGLILTKGSNKGQYSSSWFTAGKSIFVVGSTGGSGYSDPGVSFTNGVCKFPAYKNVPTERQKYVSQGVTLTMLRNPGLSDAENKQKCDLAWKFLKYITNEKNNISICLSSNGYVPVRESAYQDESYAEYLTESDYMSKCANTVVNEINGNYFNYPVFKGSDEARDAVEGIVTNVLLNKQTIDQAFATAYEKAAKAL